MKTNIDFSQGQLNIIQDIVDIYNKVMLKTLDSFHKRDFSENEKNIIEVAEELGTPLQAIIEKAEDDYFKHHDLKHNPYLIEDFTINDIVILTFILREWSNERDWNDLEVANLHLKLGILIDCKTEINLS
jgi:hypothetical protein